MTASILEDNLTANFEKDITMLWGYALIGVTTDTSAFEMDRLVQVATQAWLKGRGQSEKWQSQFIANLDPYVRFQGRKRFREPLLFASAR